MRPAEAVHIGRSGQHVHRLAEVRLVVPFRNGAAIGASVQFQEAGKKSVGVAQLNRARACRGLPHGRALGNGGGEGLGNSGHVGHRVQQHLGIQAPCERSRIIGHVLAIGGVGLV